MQTALESWILVGVGGLSAIGWRVLHAIGAFALARVPRLSLSSEQTSERFPSLSVVIAACNEVETLETAIQSLLAQDYSGLEIVIVEDRSTDGTGDLVERLAASSERIKAIHITDLPTGWLGKVNALRRGLDIANGKYILFSDADVHFSPSCLKAAMKLVITEELDHLTLFPRLLGKSLLHRALMQAFFSMISHWER